MLCECIPVGTEVCGIPVAIGDTGFYVPFGDGPETAKAIEKALQSDNGPKARERIKKLFPIEKRGELLNEAVESLIHPSKL
jgi:glycosyltransferase involved in cell wall biosynthesis